MRYEYFVSLRYLLAKRKEKFISIISTISILGVAVGVCALIVVIGVMTGFDNDLRDKIVGTNSHLVIEKEGGIEDPNSVIGRINVFPHVIAASPFLNGQVLIVYGNQTNSIILRGITPSEEIKVTRIGEYIKKGSIKNLKGEEILIGSEFANKFNLDVGDAVPIISPFDGKIRNFKVVGIFNSGMYDYDLNLAFVELRKAQELYGMETKVGGVGVKIDDVYLAEGLKMRMQRELGFPYCVRSWMDLNRSLFAALKLEKLAMFVILSLIIIVACLNIISTLIMVVMEKTKDIGILKAIGATNRSIMAIFTLEGFLIGTIGTILGVASGLGLSYLLEKYQFIQLPRDIYYIDRFPVDVQFGDTVVIVIAALMISLLSCIYPAWQASRLNPVDALRYE
ncbi:MAG: lipoprotein-releasing ABC transporter permease subunit [Candidatus Omnitrophota bacterium]